MSQPPESRRRAAAARDGAVRRLRRATQVSVAAMVALGGAFTALAAGSTHPKTAAVHRAAPKTAAAVVAAPAPPLVTVQSAATPTPTPTPTQAPAVQAPTPSYQPPVVSSGGS